MRRGSLLFVVFLLVVSVLSAVPAGAVTQATEGDDTIQFEEAEATLVQSNLFKQEGDGLYFIHLEDAPTVSYDGSIAGLAGTSNEATDSSKFNAETAEVVEYRDYLQGEHSAFLSRLDSTIGRTPQVEYQYFNALNGMAMDLTWEEASQIARMPGVAKVTKDKVHTINTDAGPVWIGADGIWDGSATGTAGAMGEGIIVGVLDTGINPANPSFADIGDDGYDHTNPFGSGNYVGFCDDTPGPQYDAGFTCNDKLIGAWNFVGDGTIFDDDGHGSHTSSTAAGNVLLDTTAEVVGPTLTVGVNISGVAPHANIISYDVCDTGGCSGAAITAGIDQAILDGVDVINYSIGSADPTDPWASASEAGFLAARTAGIFVAHSAGNEGPGYATVGSPMAPWITHVANMTHNRQYTNAVTGMTGGDTAPPADIVGLGFTDSFGPAPIVYAGDYASAETANPELCGVGTIGDFDSPWDPGTFSGEIVVCDRGTFGRVEKGANALAAGAGGFILVDNGSGLVGDAHELPGVHITQADGDVLKTWLATGTGHMASIGGATKDSDPGNGDIMNGSSSRGPNRSAEALAPTVGAPGTDIIAAYGTGNATEWNFLSGTSMASPHVAGAAALLSQLQPTWTPAMMESALAMTAVRNGLKEDGATVADPFDYGSGRVDVSAAANAALVLDETEANYLAADPAAGGDPTSLNMSSMTERECVVECSWDRTFTSTAAGSVEWTITQLGAGGIVLSADPAVFTIAPGATQTVTFTADVTGAAANEYHFGSFELTPDAAVPAAHLPVAVQPTTGSIPEIVEITTARNSGSWDVDGLEALEITDLSVDVVGLVKADINQGALELDPTNGSAFDDLSQVLVHELTVGAGDLEVNAEVIASESPDLDLWLVFDANDNGVAEEAEQVCQSASGTALESCTADAQAGRWFVVIQNWAASGAGAIDAFTFVTAVVPDSDEGNMSVIGPDSVPQLDPFEISVQWDLPDAMEGDRYYGAFSLGTDPGNAGNIGTVPVRLMRVADDVTKVADVEQAGRGDTITYTVTIEPNVTNADLEYTIEDVIPDGFSYVDGSATNGATYADGKISWTGVMPSPALAEMFWEITNNVDDLSCDTPFGGYVDLEGFGIFAQSGITGDTNLWTTGSSQNPITFYGETYTGIGLTDDGFLVFDGAANYGGSPWAAQDMPDPALPNNVAAPFWSDFEIVYDGPTNAGISLANAGPDLFIVEWDDVYAFGDALGDGPLFDMEAFVMSMNEGPELVFAYDNVTPGLAAWEAVAGSSIGLENADGSEGITLALDDAASYISDGFVVCADWVVPEFPSVEFEYRVTVDNDAAHGLTTNTATHVTDNVGDNGGEASATVDVKNYGFIPGTPYHVLTVVKSEVAQIRADADAGDSMEDIDRLIYAENALNKALRLEYWDDEEHTTPHVGRYAFIWMERAAFSLEKVSSAASFDIKAEVLARSIALAAQTLARTALDESGNDPWFLWRGEQHYWVGTKYIEQRNNYKAVATFRYTFWLANALNGKGNIL